MSRYEQKQVLIAFAEMMIDISDNMSDIWFSFIREFIISSGVDEDYIVNIFCPGSAHGRTGNGEHCFIFRERRNGYGISSCADLKRSAL